MVYCCKHLSFKNNAICLDCQTVAEIVLHQKDHIYIQLYSYQYPKQLVHLSEGEIQYGFDLMKLHFCLPKNVEILTLFMTLALFGMFTYPDLIFEPLFITIPIHKCQTRVWLP